MRGKVPTGRLLKMALQIAIECLKLLQRCQTKASMDFCHVL